MTDAIESLEAAALSYANALDEARASIDAGGSPDSERIERAKETLRQAAMRYTSETTGWDVSKIACSICTHRWVAVFQEGTDTDA